MIEDAIFAHAAVAAPHTLAAEAGRDMLVQGGNAIEAMVAMAASVAVVYPHMNSIGGDGFWIIRDPKGKVRAIEACGFAGEKATRAAYEAIGGIPTRGPMAALTVPGAIGGWKIALELSAALGGRLPLPDLIARAVEQARDGVAVSPSEQRSQPRDGAMLYDVPNFRQTYFIDNAPPKAGAMRAQKQLAETLAQLAHAGLDDFYLGDVAREIAADLEALGSPVTRADLRAYQARWREPLSIKTKSATIYNTPVPTQGLASLLILGIYERLGVNEIDGVEHAHALIEASKRAFAHRDRACVDFEIATEDFERLLSPASLQAEADRIDMRRAAPWPLPPEQGDTIWMGAIDKDGLAVSYIQSIYWEYGSGLNLPRTGVLMQNRGIAFSLDPTSPRALKPGRRPFHTLNPALAVFADGRDDVLRLYGRRRAAAIPGAGLHPHRGRRFARRRGRRAPPALGSHLGGRQRDREDRGGLRRRDRRRLGPARPRDRAACAGAAGRVRPRRRVAARRQGRDRRDARSPRRRRPARLVTTTCPSLFTIVKLAGAISRAMAFPLSRPASRSASSGRRRLHDFGWARRAFLIVAAFVGSAAIAYGANLASRNALWQVVRACVLDKTTTGSPLPCLEVDLDDSAGFAVLRPPFGRPDTILTPTRRIVGLEDPQLQAPGAPNYFALAWDARHWLPVADGASPAEDRVTLAVNSRLARTQDQLHVHIGCLSPSFASRLKVGALGPARDTWFRGPDMGPGLELWTYRTAKDWGALDPFRLLPKLAGGGAQRTTLAVTPTPTEFVVVALRSRPGGWYAAAEDVIDGRC